MKRRLQCLQCGEWCGGPASAIRTVCSFCSAFVRSASISSNDKTGWVPRDVGSAWVSFKNSSA